jgi:hypothetical protein
MEEPKKKRVMPLKVYGWQGFQHDCPTHHRQTREIIATSSIKKAAEALGYRPSDLFNVCETGNAQEIAQAMSQPGVGFWRPIDDRNNVWIPIKPRTP